MISSIISSIISSLISVKCPTDEMFMSSVNDSLCLKKEHITEFHDNIITAPYIAMQEHIPYSHK